MRPVGCVTVFEKDAFRDGVLQDCVALITAQWASDLPSCHSVTAGELVAASCGGQINSRASLIMRILGVDERWLVGALSEGQMRRVQLAVKLSKPHDLLLLDEATTDLDLVVRRNCEQTLSYLFFRSACFFFSKNEERNKLCVSMIVPYHINYILLCSAHLTAGRVPAVLCHCRVLHSHLGWARRLGYPHDAP
jgi:hypothetical protein